VVSDADAIIDPLTMVVKALNALVANITVTGISRAYNFAVGTKKVGFELLDKTNKWDVGRTPHIARLSFDCQNKEDHCPQEDHEQNGEPPVSVYVYSRKVKFTIRTYKDIQRSYWRRMFPTSAPKRVQQFCCFFQSLP
jgi:hypothetical protein